MDTEALVRKSEIISDLCRLTHTPVQLLIRAMIEKGSLEEGEGEEIARYLDVSFD